MEGELVFVGQKYQIPKVKLHKGKVEKRINAIFRSKKLKKY